MYARRYTPLPILGKEDPIKTAAADDHVRACTPVSEK